MREAIDTEKFVLHYQPVLDANTREAVAMEALVRWSRDDELVSPAEFIPALEDSGLILALGEWILRQACADAASWPAQLQVNVNLSGRQLADPSIVQHVAEALAASGLAPDRLMLEITESVIMHNTETTVQRLKELRELGVGFAIDDAGLPAIVPCRRAEDRPLVHRDHRRGPGRRAARRDDAAARPRAVTHDGR